MCEIPKANRSTRPWKAVSNCRRNNARSCWPRIAAAMMLGQLGVQAVYGTEGCRFESCRAREITQSVQRAGRKVTAVKIAAKNPEKVPRTHLDRRARPPRTGPQIRFASRLGRAALIEKAQSLRDAAMSDARHYAYMPFGLRFLKDTLATTLREVALGNSVKRPARRTLENRLDRPPAEANGGRRSSERAAPRANRPV